MTETDYAALFETTRHKIAGSMHEQAIRRFGAVRAEALRPAIGELASDAARVQLFGLTPEDRPAFYLNEEA